MPDEPEGGLAFPAPDEPKGKGNGCWGLLISMENGEHLSLEQIQAFLTGNEEIEFKAPNRKELYEWTQQALCAQSYSSLHRSGKGLMKRYIGKVTGLSRAQVTRLIGQYTKSGIVGSRQG